MEHVDLALQETLLSWLCYNKIDHSLVDRMHEAEMTDQSSLLSSMLPASRSIL